ncbi:unnamed protein product [Notodromas monacha]|uniref:DNA cross-link repair 1A protein n=1 Tax=Notodromas monacha TaxID=399045 RepID=A0A7R9G976_9CRUS|nr:unnamed protein product [Notodromas monacha]CAG0912890.1 unnamed protein product [Notodromas monacha]
MSVEVSVTSDDEVEGQMNLPGNVPSGISRKGDTLEFNTLDEPIKDTFMRDVHAVAVKFKHVLYPTDNKTLLKDYLLSFAGDLWGPLILCTFLAVILQGEETDVSGSKHDGGPEFAEVFVLVWVGSMVVTLNSKLLGGTLSFFQSVCVLGYCLLPPSVSLIFCRLVLLFQQNTLLFLFRLLFTMTGFAYAVFAALKFLGDSQPANKKVLANESETFEEEKTFAEHSAEPALSKIYLMTHCISQACMADLSCIFIRASHYSDFRHPALKKMYGNSSESFTVKACEQTLEQDSPLKKIPAATLDKIKDELIRSTPSPSTKKIKLESPLSQKKICDYFSPSSKKAAIAGVRNVRCDLSGKFLNIPADPSPEDENLFRDDDSFPDEGGFFKPCPVKEENPILASPGSPARLLGELKHPDQLISTSLGIQENIDAPIIGTILQEETVSVNVSLESFPQGDDVDIDVDQELLRFSKREESKRRWGAILNSSAHPGFEQKAAPVKSVENNSMSAPKRRRLPPFKILQGTRIAVDCFDHGDDVPKVDFFFLSHFHYDHYRGLTKQWSKPVYCSLVTGNLVISKLGVKAELVTKLAMNSPIVVEDPHGKADFSVTLLDAHHCPGAVLFLFEMKNGITYLHTGDFRAHPKMESYPELRNIRINFLYLDTTYMKGDYTFPCQEEVVDAVCKMCEMETRSRTVKPLIVCGSYSIGKEKVWSGIAKRLSLKVWLQRDRRNTLKCLNDPELTALVGVKQEDCLVHVVPMAWLNVKVQYAGSIGKGNNRHTIAIRPTGWEFKPYKNMLTKITSNASITIYGAPYSEHSSTSELERFVKFFTPLSVIATVGRSDQRKEFEATANAWSRSILMKT